MLDQHLHADGSLDHAKLRETIRIAVRALDDVIDINFYPTEPAATANARHRPVGLGVMGLQYALYRRGVAFASPDGRRRSPTRPWRRSPTTPTRRRRTWPPSAGRTSPTRARSGTAGCSRRTRSTLLEDERGEDVEVERGGQLDWAPLRAKIAAQGMRNSNVLAIAPTATIANIMGTSPCIEPTYKNLFAKSNLSGDFIVLNPFLVRDLKAAGLWDARDGRAAEGGRGRRVGASRACPPSCASATGRRSRSSPSG